MFTFLVVAIGLPYLFKLGPADGLNHKSNLYVLCALATFLLSDIIFLLRFEVSEYRKQKVNLDPQGFNLSIVSFLNLILSQVNLAKIYINFAFSKILIEIEDRENQGEYFEIFVMATCFICIASQWPNLYSLKKTFDALMIEFNSKKN